MKIAARLFAVLVAGTSACQLTHDPGDGRIASAQLAISSTCGATRWIGMAAPCASLGSWSASPLFGGVSLPFSRYCAYDWTGSSPPTASDIAALTTLSGATKLGEDCPVVLPQSYDELLADSLRTSLHAQTGTVDGVGLSVAPKVPVRVVVVDTAPDSGQSTTIVPGNDRHGDTLASVIRDIGCGSRVCATEVTSSLGLPWLDETTQTSAGGHVGRLSDVALAIYHGLQYAAAAGRKRVIVNLSVGWEDVPDLAECGNGQPVNAPTRAVYDVIQKATCTGNLVIAAAGNDAGGLTPPAGMICPGRWEALPLADCAEHTGEPMLHAVGGVDYADQPIAITRPGGRPRLAAPSLGGVGWTPADPVPPPITGTSVATAVASGVASVVWAENPSLWSKNVMDLVHTSGVYLRAADTCPAGTNGSCDTRRISLCTALAAAGITGLRCSAAPALAQSSPPLGQQVLVAAGQEITGAAGAAVAEQVDPITLPRYLADSPALSGGVFPQPVVPVCPSCFFSILPSAPIFYANLAAPVNGASLVLETGTLTMAAPLTTTTGSPSLAAGAYAIQVSAAPRTVTRAWLTGYSDTANTTSVTQEVVISE